MERLPILWIVVATACLSGCAAVIPIPDEIGSSPGIDTIVAAYEAGNICQLGAVKGIGRPYRIKRPIYVYANGRFKSDEVREWIGKEDTTETPDDAAAAVFVVKEEFWSQSVGTLRNMQTGTTAGGSGTGGRIWFCIVQPTNNSVFFKSVSVEPGLSGRGFIGASSINTGMRTPKWDVRDMFWDEIGFEDVRDPIYRIVVEFQCRKTDEDGKVVQFFYTKPYWSSVSCKDAVTIFEQDAATRNVCETWGYDETRSTRIDNVYRKARPNEVPCAW